MTKFAPVAPPRLLQNLKAHNAMGDYHLLLAHDIAENASEYHNVFNGLEDATIILDNSVVELGKPVSPEVMIETSAIVNATIAVLPDHLLDSAATIASSIEAASHWRTQGFRVPFMIVPQGRTIYEWIGCCVRLTEAIRFSTETLYYSIPRCLTDCIGTRMSALEYLTMKMGVPSNRIHLLGFSDNIMDDINCCIKYQPMGIDSAVPIRMGLDGVPLRRETKRWDKPRGDYWETAHEVNQHVIGNLKHVRDWIDDNQEGEETEGTSTLPELSISKPADMRDERKSRSRTGTYRRRSRNT